MHLHKTALGQVAAEAVECKLLFSYFSMPWRQYLECVRAALYIMLLHTRPPQVS